MAETSQVDLPPEVGDDFEVYVNGVRQQPGVDFRRVGEALVFPRPLAGEGRLGFWRWLSLFLGVSGTYRRNDTVDVVYRAEGGRRVVASLQPRVVQPGVVQPGAVQPGAREEADARDGG